MKFHKSREIFTGLKEKVVIIWKKCGINWTAKLICLAVAILIVLFYNQEKVEERYLNVPFKIIGSGAFATAEEIPNHVRVHLRGKKEDIYSIIGDDLNVFADFSDVIHAGACERSIQVQLLGTARYMNPLEVSVEPKSVHYLFEDKIVKRVPIDAVMSGTPADGYQITSSFLTPTYTSVQGPASVINNVYNLKTLPIDISGRVSDFSIPVEVDNWNRNISVIGSDINLTVKISRIKINKTFSGINITLSNASENFIFITNTLTGTVKIESGTGDIDKISTSGFKLFCDLKSITSPGRYKVPVRIVVPDKADLISFSPESLDVIVSEIPVSSKSNKY